MGCFIDTKEYEKMVADDVAWLLRNLPPCPQRDRIVGVFKAIEENAKELREQKQAKTFVYNYSRKAQAPNARLKRKP